MFFPWTFPAWIIHVRYSFAVCWTSSNICGAMFNPCSGTLRAVWYATAVHECSCACNAHDMKTSENGTTLHDISLPGRWPIAHTVTSGWREIETKMVWAFCGLRNMQFHVFLLANDWPRPENCGASSRDDKQSFSSYLVNCALHELNFEGLYKLTRALTNED